MRVSDLYDQVLECWTLREALEAMSPSGRTFEAPVESAADDETDHTWLNALKALGEVELEVAGRRLRFVPADLADAAAQDRLRAGVRVAAPTVDVDEPILAYDPMGPAVITLRDGPEGDLELVNVGVIERRWDTLLDMLAEVAEDLRADLAFASRTAAGALRPALSDAELVAIDQALAPHRVSALRIAPGDAIDDPGLWQSRFGGAAPFLDESHWPRLGAVPGVLALQVDLADLLDVDVLGDVRGVFCVFEAQDTTADLEPEEAFAVCFVARHDDEVAPPPSDADLRPARRIAIEVADEAPGAEFASDELIEEVFAAVEGGMAAAVEDYWLAQGPTGADKLFGYPAWQQDPEVPLFDGEPGALLLQWNAGVRFYVFVDPSDFRRVQMSWDVD